MMMRTLQGTAISHRGLDNKSQRRKDVAVTSSVLQAEVISSQHPSGEIIHMRSAVYAGSFDPLTNGHLWMIEQGARLFDKLIVAVGTNPEKSYTYSLEQRMEMLCMALTDNPAVEVAHFHNRFLVDFAREKQAGYILRGIRTSSDFEYERVMRHINDDMAPSVTTIFLMPPRDIAELSSSMVKGLIGPVGWERQVRRYVPEYVFRLMTADISSREG